MQRTRGLPCIAGIVLSLAATAATRGQEVTGFELVDARADRDIGALEDGAAIDLNELATPIAIRANVRGEVGSVRFVLDGDAVTTENVAPYALAGDTEGDYRPWTPSPGEHRLEAIPYSGRGGGGRKGKPAAIAFTVAGEPASPAERSSRHPDIASAEELGEIPEPTGGSGEVSGELRRWHRATVTFEGPRSSATGKPNPFLHYRLNVRFTHGDRSFLVPGYFAGDGEGGSEGTRWRAHFAPPEPGTWSYRASFRAGYRVNVRLEDDAGEPTACDGASGSFEVEESARSGADFRSPGKGLLANRGHHYLTFAGSGRPWVKGGPDIPENFLGYVGFHNTPEARHRFAAHATDWRPGDPDWDDGAGRGIIGALNFIADRGANSIYFLPMNIGGDGKDTYPTVGPQEATRYDNTKLRQWETVFTHAQSRGIFLHFQLAETEEGNETYHDGGRLGVERKLYYRELVARFGHHNGLEFDLGEENDYGTERRERFAAFIKAVDPYDHPVTTHTHNGQYGAFYEPLLGNDDFDLTAFQGGDSRRSMAELIVEWRRRSAETGVPWAISFDEPQKIENDPDDVDDGYPHGRRDKMWPVYLSGGAGFEWYVQRDGGGHGLDQRIEDFREMEPALRWSGNALAFLERLPLLEMEPRHELGTSAGESEVYVLARPGSVYALYSDRSGTGVRLDLREAEGPFRVRWYDPRAGGELARGTVPGVRGGAVVELGAPPHAPEEDWAILVTAE